MPPAPSDTSQEQSERRSILLAGAGLFGTLLVLVAVAIVFSGGAGDPSPVTAPGVACAPGDRVCLASQQSGERPGIIPRPGEGQAPTEPGQRGGWIQISLLVLIVGAVSAIAWIVVRSSRRSRRAEPETAGDDGTTLGRAP